MTEPCLHCEISSLIRRHVSENGSSPIEVEFRIIEVLADQIIDKCRPGARQHGFNQASEILAALIQQAIDIENLEISPAHEHPEPVKAPPHLRIVK